MVARHPSLFYTANDIWWQGEAFMAVEAALLPEIVVTDIMPDDPHPIGAADLALLYMGSPDSTLWRRFLWTRDVDKYGRPVYVAGIGQHGIPRFQIHRWLEKPDAWWVRFA